MRKWRHTHEEINLSYITTSLWKDIYFQTGGKGTA